MFSPRFIRTAKSLIPSSLVDRLDPFEAAIRRFVEATARTTPARSRVLDAGAGEGRFKPLFQHARYVGIDFGQGDTSWDYTKLEVVGRLEGLPFKDCCFDRALSIVVLEHTSEPAQVIAELHRVVAPGGTVHLVVPHMWEEHQKPHDYFRFTSNGIRYLMERAGFRVERVEPVGGFFWMLGRRLIAVVSFAQGGWRWVLFPFLAPVFGVVLPLCCYYLDRLDVDRAYTLGFVCEGSRS